MIGISTLMCHNTSRIIA